MHAYANTRAHACALTLARPHGCAARRLKPCCASPRRAQPAATAMAIVQERVHPAGLDFQNQRKAVLLREVHGMAFTDIASKVTNMKGGHPTPRTVANVHRRFSSRLGRRPYKYHKCGRKPWKLSKSTERFLIRKLVQLRGGGACTAAVLQRVIARERGVQVSVERIRKALRDNGYHWLPRTLKRKYSAPQRDARFAFAQSVLDIPPERLMSAVTMFMDGVVLSMPPADATARSNYCCSTDDHVWRKPSESSSQALAGGDRFHKQVPIERAIPLWGGIGPRGFTPILFHARKKLRTGEWISAVEGGGLRDALTAVSARRRRPWVIVCDNEMFLHAAEVKAAHTAAGVVLWHVPPHSPDLNPIEKFWSWLRRRLVALDLRDAAEGRRALSKMAYRERVRSLCRSARAHAVAAACSRNFRRACEQVVGAQGGAVHG